jgi:hypothetical protein
MALQNLSPLARHDAHWEVEQAALIVYRLPAEDRRPEGASAAISPVWDMHPTAYGLWVGCWALLFSIMTWTFLGSASALFLLAMIGFYAAMFFAVPAALGRFTMANRPAQHFADFLDSDMPILGGWISGREALVQMTMVPLALAFGAVFISNVVAWARAL